MVVFVGLVDLMAGFVFLFSVICIVYICGTVVCSFWEC